MAQTDRTWRRKPFEDEGLAVIEWMTTSGTHLHKKLQRLAQPFFFIVKILFPALALGLAGCAGQVSNHGHVFSQEEVSQIRPGMSKDQVKLVLGTPDTKSSIGGDAYYYISSKHETVAFLPTKVVDRKILAVYFDQYSTTTKIANYGLKDGKVVDIMSGQTPSHGKELGLLKQMFGNLGKTLAL